jgi:hypothetical protein
MTNTDTVRAYLLRHYAPGNEPLIALDRLTRDAAAALDVMAEREKALVAERNDARQLARNLFGMVSRETWRAQGAEWMGHYEGDRWAEKAEAEIRSWEQP